MCIKQQLVHCWGWMESECLLCVWEECLICGGVYQEVPSPTSHNFGVVISLVPKIVGGLLPCIINFREFSPIPEIPWTSLIPPPVRSSPECVPVVCARSVSGYVRVGLFVWWTTSQIVPQSAHRPMCEERVGLLWCILYMLVWVSVSEIRCFPLDFTL